MKTIRSLAPAVAVLVIVVSSLTPLVTYAHWPDGHEPDLEPIIGPLEEDISLQGEESLYWENCNGTGQGIVYNNSSHMMQVKGDHADHPFQFHIRDLPSGRNSLDDTDLCDVDYTAFKYVKWWWFWEERNAGQFSSYLGGNEYDCVNQYNDANEGRCRYFN